ncbi:hypothetical protein HOY80DRAFT_1035565 [Tuber brumale]|nr:hypothetical protein HOY80DRAFT_1035565 [Tuber brumale]
MVTQHLTNLSVGKCTTIGVGSRDESRRFRDFESGRGGGIYLRTFNDPAVLEAEDKHRILFNDSPPNPPVELTAAITAGGSNNGSASVGGNGGGITEDLSARLLTLEKTILPMHDSLLREPGRLREPQSIGQEKGGGRRWSKNEAPARTRDAPIARVESQLPHTAIVDGPGASTALPTPTGGVEITGAGERRERTSLEDLLSDINASCDEYLSARREVVEVLSAVSQTLTQLAPITTPHSESAPAAAATAKKTPPQTPLPPPPILKVLTATLFLSALASRQKSLLTTLEEKADDNGTFTIATAGARRDSSAGVQLAKRVADKETVRMEMFGKEVAACLCSAGVTLEGVFAL